MPSIKFNQLTKETELKGSESFIESNFDKIQVLLVESYGVRKKVRTQGKAKINPEPMPLEKMKESLTNPGLITHEPPGPPPVYPATTSTVPEIPPVAKAARPPLRKYIRKVGMPGDQKIVVEVIEPKEKEISLESLREKFGLSAPKISGITRDADKRER